jgi:hypothetical protein
VAANPPSGLRRTLRKASSETLRISRQITNFRKLAGPSLLSRVCKRGSIFRAMPTGRKLVPYARAGTRRPKPWGGADNSRPFTAVRDRSCRIFAVRRELQGLGLTISNRRFKSEVQQCSIDGMAE